MCTLPDPVGWPSDTGPDANLGMVQARISALDGRMRVLEARVYRSDVEAAAAALGVTAEEVEGVFSADELEALVL